MRNVLGGPARMGADFDKEVQAMLVLSRKRGESIRIGRDVEVTVLEIRGDRVKLGFRGPPEVPIHREEVHQQIARTHPTGRPAGCA
jgi:carbon storage regulator CsrA